MSDLFDRAMVALRPHLKGRVTWAVNPPLRNSIFDHSRDDRREHEWPRMDLEDLKRDEKAEGKP